MTLLQAILEHHVLHYSGGDNGVPTSVHLHKVANGYRMYTVENGQFAGEVKLKTLQYLENSLKFDAFEVYPSNR